MTPAARTLLHWGRDRGATVELAGTIGGRSRLSVLLTGERVDLEQHGAQQVLTATETGRAVRQAPWLLARGPLSCRATRRALERLGY